MQRIEIAMYKILQNLDNVIDFIQDIIGLF